jgi:hypothetical protein
MQSLQECLAALYSSEKLGGNHLATATAHVKAGEMKGTKTLATNTKFPDQQLRDFTLEVVNASDSQVDGSDDYLPQRYRQFFPSWDRDIQLFAEFFSVLRDPNHPDPHNPSFQNEARRLLCRGVISELRDRMRAIWEAPIDSAEWRLFQLQFEIHARTNIEDTKSRTLYPPSPDTPIELAIDWLRKNLLKLQRCRNLECSRPFFIARSGQQRFCSNACIAVAQKAHKRRWWRKEKGRQGDVKPDAKMDVEVEMGPRKKSTTASGKPEHLKRFLQGIVNANENDFNYILKVYIDAGFLPHKTRSERVVAFHPELMTQEDLRSNRRQEMYEVIERLREGLRGIWSADEFVARWRLFSLQKEIWDSMDPSHYLDDMSTTPPSADRLVHQALGYLRSNLHMLRTCANAACNTPFFIADRARQSYCSYQCATPAQREYKTRWWREKGSEWRKARRRKKKSRKPERRSS